jgi:hypothetical protein
MIYPKYPFFFAVLFLILSGCARNVETHEVIIRQHSIIRQLERNQSIWRYIIEHAGTSGNPRIQVVVEKARETVSWREKYFKDQSPQNRISYADSISNRYGSLSSRDEQMEAALGVCRKNMIEKGDLINTLNLTWYALYAETALLEDYNDKTAAMIDWATTKFPTILNDSTFLPGDTVLVLVSTFASPDTWQVNFDAVSCQNVQTHAEITPAITKLEAFYLLRYIPREKGRYHIHGPVTIFDGVYKRQLPITDEFAVE